AERDGRYVLQAVYNPRLFRRARIEALVDGYLRLLADLTADPERPVREPGLRPAGSALPGGTGELPGWGGPGVVERVLRHAAQAPESTAISGEDRQLTYAGLAELASRTRAAVTAGETVAVLAERTPELPALMLGVLSAGARWAVLDVAIPPARLAAQARAAGATRLLVCPGVTVPPELAFLEAIPSPPPAAPGGGGGNHP